MAESEARNWVLVWVENLHRRAGSKRFWEEEQERIDLGTCCLILSCTYGKYGLQPISGRVDRASATEAVDTGSIPGRVKPKTIIIGIHSFPA